MKPCSECGHVDGHKWSCPLNPYNFQVPEGEIEKEDAPAEHHPEYRRGIIEAIMWLLQESPGGTPEQLAARMTRSLLRR